MIALGAVLHPVNMQKTLRTRSSGKSVQVPLYEVKGLGEDFVYFSIFGTESVYGHRAAKEWV